MEAIVSIHDVTPATLGRVEVIINAMPEVCRRNLILLVVPGLPWETASVKRLQQWQDDGMLLAGHGWCHRAASIRGFRHRLHSLLISRDAAEHLALDEPEICALIQRNFDWFAEHNLNAPLLYVPPAWALGNISTAALRRLPFPFIETTGGIMETSSGRNHLLPLVGFEADTRLRAGLLTVSNFANLCIAQVRRPLRISIHPFDPEYFLAASLERLLDRVSQNHHFAEAVSQGAWTNSDGSL